jgi:hypothetical protein
MSLLVARRLITALLVLLLISSSIMTAQSAAFYRIGTAGKPWSEVECAKWKDQTQKQRSYKEQVLDKLDTLKETMIVEQYGALPHDPDRYPLYAVKPREWQPDKPHVLVTGGVHGYETSGVQGALLFLQTKAQDYAKDFNIVVAPCISPWAYEHIQRWQADLQDPNRSFNMDAPTTDESKAIMEYLNKLGVSKWTCHVDLHETTDTDATEFRPAKHAKAGLLYENNKGIPDGFYVVGDSVEPQLDFLQAVNESVQKVTHIAPSDDEGNLIGEPAVRNGAIVLPLKELGLCGSVTGATYSATTEVYPDSPRATDAICNQAQVAAVTGALDYILAQQQKLELDLNILESAPPVE